MKVFIENNSGISGKFEGYFEVGDPVAAIPWDAPIITAFLEDADLQEMTICSTNLGFVKTIRKNPNET